MKRWIPRDLRHLFRHARRDDVLVAGEVGIDCTRGISHEAGQVDHRRRVPHRRGQLGNVRDIPFEQLEVGRAGERGERLRSVHHAIEHPNTVASLQQSLDRQRADVARAADHEHRPVPRDRQPVQWCAATIGQTEQQPGNDGRRERQQDPERDDREGKTHEPGQHACDGDRSPECEAFAPRRRELEVAVDAQREVRDEKRSRQEERACSRSAPELRERTCAGRRRWQPRRRPRAGDRTGRGPRWDRARKASIPGVRGSEYRILASSPLFDAGMRRRHASARSSSVGRPVYRRRHFWPHQPASTHAYCLTPIPTTLNPCHGIIRSSRRTAGIISSSPLS